MNDLKKFADLTRSQIGDSEEDVKINFIVPFLESLGHDRLSFEYKHKDIFIKNDIQPLTVIVETKKYGKPLDPEISQLERYCNEEHPLLGLITNGEEIRIYSPEMKRTPLFSERIIYFLKRSDLANDEIHERLYKVLSKENLENDTSAINNIDDREKEIRSGKKEIDQKIKEFENQISEKKKEIEELENLKVEKEKELKEKYLLPVINKKIPKKVADISTDKNKITKVSSKRNVRNEYLVIENRAEITINTLESALPYSLIPYSQKFKNFFPERGTEFELETDIGTFSAKVQVANNIKGTPHNKLKEWYEKHKELTNGDKLIISVLEPYKRYKLELEHY